MSESTSGGLIIVAVMLAGAALVFGLIGVVLPDVPQIESGTVTVPSGASTIEILHNLGATPSSVVFTPSYETTVYLFSKNSTCVVATLTVAPVTNATLEYIFCVPQT